MLVAGCCDCATKTITLPDAKRRVLEPFAEKWATSIVPVIVPPVCSYTDVLDGNTRTICANIKTSTGVNLIDYCPFVPLTRCSFHGKPKAAHIRNCSKFVNPHIAKAKRAVLLGKLVVSHVLFEGISPPSMECMHGRVVSRDGIEYMIFIGPDTLKALIEESMITREVGKLEDFSTKFRMLLDKADTRSVLLKFITGR